MKTLERLRRAGLTPASAFVWFGIEPPVRDWLRSGLTPSIHIPADANIERLDVRPFKGIFVAVLTQTYTDSFYRLLGRLAKLSEGVTGYVFDWRDGDMGFYIENGEEKTLRDHLEGK